MPLKLDLHVHTHYSRDSITTLEDVACYSKKAGLDGIAITDHDTVEGSLTLLKKRLSDIIVIPGIEVTTNQGHLIGLNVRKVIPPHLNLRRTIKEIHEAGGIAIIPHPFAVTKSGIWLSKKVYSNNFDALEVINSSAIPFFLLRYLGNTSAEKRKIPRTAGSDSHLPEMIGQAYTIIDNVEKDASAEDIAEAIRNNETVPMGKPIPWKYRFRKILVKKRKVKSQILYKPKFTSKGSPSSSDGSNW